MLVAGEDVEEVIDDGHGVVAVPREVEDALGVLHANLVTVGVVHHLGLLLQRVNWSSLMSLGSEFSGILG